MRLDYNKLVRDRIPEIIRADGKRCEIVIMSDSEYRQALLDKLVEEAQEARQAMNDDLIRELADIEEVLAAILATWEISPDAVSQIQHQRYADRGDVSQRLKLLWTEDGNKDV